MDPRHITPNKGDPILLVGTTKGAFLLRSDVARQKWEVAGPYCQGESVYALYLDTRSGRRRLWAAFRNEHYAPELISSDDYGRTWRQPTVPLLAYPADTGLAVARIWQMVPGPDADTLYCGVEPAGLFVSRDGGESWSLVRGLHDHPHRPQWNPGGGGLCLHTILPHPNDPKRVIVAISAGGTYITDDGGASWRASNKGIRADFNPEPYPEFGQCVHKIARDPTNPERLFMQNHGGIYRSDNGGAQWNDIAKGVPSDFGFAMVTHPRAANTAYIVPLEAPPGMRTAPDGKLRVFRTRNGETWEPLDNGLPTGTYETVLRDGMCSDRLDPAGLFLGTRSGSVYGSADEGASWKPLCQGLPPVVCVKAAVA